VSAERETRSKPATTTVIPSALASVQYTVELYVQTGRNEILGRRSDLLSVHLKVMINASGKGKTKWTLGKYFAASEKILQFC
jgi:hypothetical protein